MFVPAAGEMIEMRYEFEQDWVVDHSAYAAVLGDHATPLDTSLVATVTSYQAREASGGRRQGDDAARVPRRDSGPA
jgi:hypothetical protein